MCGIAGFLDASGSIGADEASALAQRMGEALRHRGPDSGATWIDPDSGLGFSHRRLAIVDLSPAGAQPMHSPSGRYVLTFNGEIYNHMDLRAELQNSERGTNWKGHCDTETLLAGIDAWGIEDTLKRVIGMFAFGLWDRKEKALTLARDRMGEKPLYYGWQKNGQSAALLFGSELKALARHPAFAGEIDRQALSLFMRDGYIPAPHSIYRGIAKLRPGTLVTLSADQPEGEPRTYWSVAAAAAAASANPIQGSTAEALDGLERLLLDAVGKQLMSDVPLGAFLSGGIDSSTITALMQVHSSRPVKTFTVGFGEKEFNEAEEAKRVAAHLGTDHHELNVSPADAMAVIPRLPAIYDEPFADSSQIPTFLVMQLARRHVTVALSGDGGDELFGGYERYTRADQLWRRIRRIPKPFRRAAGAAVQLVPGRTWNRVGPALGLSPRYSLPGDVVHKLGRVAGGDGPVAISQALGHRWDGDSIVVDSGTRDTFPTEAHSHLGRTSAEAMMAVDMQSYLPDDILAKVDRAGMAVSLESRVPFLDHRVVEYALRLPAELKIAGGKSKWALREILSRYIPRELVERPKMGFSVPLNDWLRGPLKGWAEELLDDRQLKEDGHVDADAVRAVWLAHLRGDCNAQAKLWPVLMFRAWLNEQPASA